MNKQEKLTEEEQVKLLIKRLMMAILVLVLVVIIGVGAVIYYFVSKYNDEKGTLAPPEETARNFKTSCVEQEF